MTSIGTKDTIGAAFRAALFWGKFMGWEQWLSIASNFAQAATGLLAGAAAIYYFYRKADRRWKMEAYLQEARCAGEQGNDMGARSIVHLMGNCTLTEAQVLEAAFSSSKIRSWVTVNDEGRADRLLFQFNDKAWRRVKDNKPTSKRRTKQLP
jgi:hypothetical protein